MHSRGYGQGHGGDERRTTIPVPVPSEWRAIGAKAQVQGLGQDLPELTPGGLSVVTPAIVAARLIDGYYAQLPLPSVEQWSRTRLLAWVGGAATRNVMLTYTVPEGRVLVVTNVDWRGISTGAGGVPPWTPTHPWETMNILVWSVEVGGRPALSADTLSTGSTILAGIGIGGPVSDHTRPAWAIWAPGRVDVAFVETNSGLVASAPATLFYVGVHASGFLLAYDEYFKLLATLRGEPRSGGGTAR